MRAFSPIGGSRRLSLHGILVAGACIPLGLTATVWAQSAAPLAPSPVIGSLDTAFQDMSKDLADANRSFRYAQTAVKSGASTEAVAALERVLRQDPSRDNIRLELGILYVALGNPRQGATYIETALKNPSIPPNVRARAEKALAEARKAASPHQFSGVAYVGLGYDTNINNAPGSPGVLLFGAPATLTPGSTATPDGSLTAYLYGRYTYDLGQQNTNRLEVNGFGNVQGYFNQGDYNVGVIGGDIGPWLAAPIGVPGTSEFRPYLTGYNFAYGGAQYLAQGGAGLAMRHLLNADWSVTASAQAVQQGFTNSSFRPTSSLQTGPEYRVQAGLQYRISPGQFASLDMGYAHKDAKVDWYAYDLFTVGVGYTIEYDDPTGLLNLPWASTIGAVFRNYVYLDPDPAVSPTQTRHDRRFEVSFTQLIGLYRSASLMLKVGYVNTLSNMPNYQFRNFSTAGGVQVTF